MSEVRVNNLSNENNTGGPTISGITTYSGRHFFVPPQGDTASRPSDCEPGSLRFNTDSAHLEYYRGDTIGWVDIDADNGLITGTASGTGSNENSLGARGISGGAHIYVRTIEFVTISTLGDSQDFGDLTVAAGYSRGQSASNETRMLFAGGYGNPFKNNIEFITVQSQGNSTDFGDMSVNRLGMGAVSDKVRAVRGGGQTQPSSPYYTNVIDYVEFSTTGNAVDFGDTVNSGYRGGTCNSSTRGIFCYSSYPSQPYCNFDTVITRTTGNAIDFAEGRGGYYNFEGGGGNGVRGIFAGTYISTLMDYLTISHGGITQDFGDLVIRKYRSTTAASSTRWCSIGAQDYVPDPASTVTRDEIEFVQIATTGDAVDFGDMSYLDGTGGTQQSNSNAHGGLSG